MNFQPPDADMYYILLEYELHNAWEKKGHSFLDSAENGRLKGSHNFCIMK